MQEKDRPHPQKLYRIGDYARFMGVSTDLLKHYEKFGLIHSEPTENGYRYYRFQESVPLLECRKLQNYGLPLREMDVLLHASCYDEVEGLLDDKIMQMQRRIHFEQMVVSSHQEFKDWMQAMAGDSIRCEIANAPATWFLPHSVGRDFIRDDRISSLLPVWEDAMPLVCICRLMPQAGQGAEMQWGLLVRQEDALSLDLPRNDVVRVLPARRSLYIHYHRQWLADTPQYQQLPLAEILSHYPVDVSAPMVQCCLMSSQNAEAHFSCGFFCVPMKEEASSSE